MRINTIELLRHSLVFLKMSPEMLDWFVGHNIIKDHKPPIWNLFVEGRHGVLMGIIKVPFKPQNSDWILLVLKRRHRVVKKASFREVNAIIFDTENLTVCIELAARKSAPSK
jgi:hypothetical protein